MSEELELQKCISELENSFNKAIGFLRTCTVNNSIQEVRKYLDEATNALNALSEFKDERNVTSQDDVNIDEYSDHEHQQSDDEWGGNVDDFDDMIKACEDAEQSINCIEDASDHEKSFETEVESEEPEVGNGDKCPSAPETFDCDPPSEVHLRILKQFFGHTSFRPMQWKILRAVLEEKRDVSAVMATGYGKSLCYQYPAVYLNKPVVVISPLISLMEDQVMALNVANIDACFLGSAQTQMSKVKEGILNGKYKVVYMTPEFVVEYSGKDLLSSLDKCVGISLFAIDESHCVSHWGHDFRGAYRNLGTLRTTFNHVPFIAVTATATPTVQNDICNSLKLKNPVRVVSSFDRPNLFLEVSMKSASPENDFLRIMTRTSGKLGFSGPTIIYCPTRSATESIHKALLGIKVPSQMYHAGMSPDNRKQAHRDFVYDKVEVIVATVAFGMGIDKPDVRRIIHYGAPKDIESYYQEIGRAGRDGLPSICQVFYSNADFLTSKFFLRDIKSEKFYQHRADMMSKMQQYLNTTHCRRQMLLSHFEGSDLKSDTLSDKCCDNCKKRLRRAKLSKVNGSSQQDLDEKKDFSAEARMLFEAIIATGGAFGLTVPVYIVRGSANQRISDSMKKCKSYGKGKKHSEQWWKALGRLLLGEKYLIEQKPNSYGSSKKFAGVTINVTPKAKQWLEKVYQSSTEDISLILEMNAEMTNLEEAKAAISAKLASSAKVYSPLPTSSRKTPTSPIEELQQLKPLPEMHEVEEAELDPIEEDLKAELYKKLMTLRNSLADGEGIAPYMVFSNKNLLDIAVHRPTSLQSMSQIEGVTSARISKFGQPMINLVVSFCKENNLKEDVFAKKENLDNGNVNKSDHHLIYQLSSSAQQTYTLYEIDGKSLESVSKERKLAQTTIFNHLVDAIKVGLPVRLKDLGVTNEMYEIVKKVIVSPPINSDVSRMTPIKQLCPDYIEFNHLKVIIALFQNNFDVTSLKKAENKTTDQSSQSILDGIKEEPISSHSEMDISKTNDATDSILKRKDVSSVDQPILKKIKSNKLFKL